MLTARFAAMVMRRVHLSDEDLELAERFAAIVGGDLPAGHRAAAEPKRARRVREESS